MLRQGQQAPHKAGNGMAGDPGDLLSPLKRRAGPQPRGGSAEWKASAALLLLFILLAVQLRQLALQTETMQMLRGSQAQAGPPQPGAKAAEGHTGAATAAPAASRSASGAWQAPVYKRCEIAILGGRRRDGYGSWPLCVNQVPPGAIVYSFGIGLDASFDAAMIQRGAAVYGFDPTIKPESISGLFGPRSKEFMSQFHFMQVGLGASNGVATFLKARRPGIQSMTALGAGDTGQAYHDVGFQAAVLTLPALMAIQGHSHVDLLKVDVEGIEFQVCEQREGFLDALGRVGQVIYEFHERLIRNPEGRKERCIAALAERGFTLVNRTESEEYVFSRVTADATVVNLPKS